LGGDRKKDQITRSRGERRETEGQPLGENVTEHGFGQECKASGVEPSGYRTKKKETGRLMDGKGKQK